MLHVDIPTAAEIDRLAAARGPAHVSIYLPTTPETQHIGTARIALGNLLKEAETQLAAAGAPKRTVRSLSEQVADLIDDDDFWAHQANSLALFATPEALQSFRLPSHLTATVQVADRFHIKPLLRAVTVGQHAFVLALAENGVRLIEVFADLPAREVRVHGLPRDAAGAAGTASVNSRSYSGRIGGAEGQKTLLRSYCRKVDAALRPVLSGRPEPLILAATEPLLSMFRSVATFPGLAAEAIRTSPDRMAPGALAEAARPILDAIHAALIATVQARFASLRGAGRATTDIATAARAATAGAVELLMVDIDGAIPGTLDEATGAVTFAAAEGAGSYGVVDEIARRTIATGGRVLAVRAGDIPDGAPLAAILRHPV
jgi:hypothetical protein